MTSGDFRANALWFSIGVLVSILSQFADHAFDLVLSAFTFDGIGAENRPAGAS